MCYYRLGQTVEQLVDALQVLVLQLELLQPGSTEPAGEVAQATRRVLDAARLLSQELREVSSR